MQPNRELRKTGHLLPKETAIQRRRLQVFTFFLSVSFRTNSFDRTFDRIASELYARTIRSIVTVRFNRARRVISIPRSCYNYLVFREVVSWIIVREARADAPYWTISNAFKDGQMYQRASIVVTASFSSTSITVSFGSIADHFANTDVSLVRRTIDSFIDRVVTRFNRVRVIPKQSEWNRIISFDIEENNVASFAHFDSSLES